MPSILPGPGNAKNHFLKKSNFRKSNTVDDILNQIARSKAQNVQKNLLFILLSGVDLLKKSSWKVMAAGTRNKCFSRKTVITFFLVKIQSSSLNRFLSIGV